jgi:pimeloyl-ACP methyl ester carboxylesterase
MRAYFGLGVLVLALVFGGAWLHHRLLCAGLFLRLGNEVSAPAWLHTYGEAAVESTACGPAYAGPCTVYAPIRRGVRGGIVLAHGIHAEAIAEPRLIALAQALASTGFRVVTPLLADLASYRVTHQGAEVISATANALARELDVPSVVVFGISFGGGLALRAACEPALNPPIARVIALGAHNDAVRTARFFLGERALGPGGEQAEVLPHSYGREVLWHSLYGTAHKGPFSDAERAELSAALATPPEALLLASPSHCPGPVNVPVYLAHGEGDRIVPFTETLWNKAQLGPQTSVTALISPAIAHAEYHPPALGDRLLLIDFMARAAF